MFPSISPKQSFPALESEVLAYWKANKTFEKSIESRPVDNPYRFYDGPPFITGMPHYGSLLSSIVKDVVGRYWTMRGKRVDRVWGWDCHGLPIEEKVQKKLGLSSNKEIEERGVKEFIDGCYEYTASTSAEWTWYIDKIGRWVDMDRAYRTMDQDYMESVMWVFSELWKKGLIYEGKRVSLYSWKLGTPISNFEVAMDDTYQTVDDPAITVKFELELNDRFPAGTKVLAWTTTPWTIPANMALAVRNDIDYVLVENNSEHFILAKNRAETVLKGKGEYSIIREFKGSELVGLGYIPPFPEYYYKKQAQTDTQTEGKENGKNNSDVSVSSVRVSDSKNHKIYHADFITDTDGTGIGHEAPEFGDVDFQLAKKEGIYISEAMDEAGKYTREIFDYEGTHYQDANKVNIERMKENGSLFKLESITHRVPFCPRSATPLVQKAQKSWFIDIQSQKEKLLKANEQINWFPEHLKYGRFAKGIESAPDWCISRTRYWGAPMPVWMGADGEQVVVSSREEIYEMNKPYGQLTKLIITRHAESVANVERHYDDIGTSPLSPNGFEQAKALMKELKDTGVEVIITSPFLRAIQTAEPLAKELGIEIITDERLKEIDHGKMANAQSSPEVKKERAITFFGEDKNHKFAEIGESYNDILLRTTTVLDEICEKYPGKTVLVVSHGFPTGVMSAYLRDKQIKTEIKNAEIETFILDVAHKKQLNLHKPYIDSIFLAPKNARKAEKVLGIHGWTSRGLKSGEDGFWFYTKHQLEKEGIQMDVPDFDKNEDTKYSLWKEQLDTIDLLSYDTVVAHSLGCAISMQYILENKIKLERLVLVAPSGLVGNSFLEKLLPEMTADKSELRKLVSELIIVHSKDDASDSAKFEYGKSLAEEIGAVFVTVDGFGHAMNKGGEKIVYALTLLGAPLTRIPEVLDVWMDSGSMPYAQMHYPFENQSEMQASFPADFIAEYVGQVRAWFYVMHVLGVLVNPNNETSPTPSFTNVITTGVINGNDGRKMSKSYGNYPDPRATIEKYGADPIRFYMLNSPLLSGGDMDFKEEQIVETIKGVMLPLWNTYSFFTTYANIDNWTPDTTEIWFSRHAESTSNVSSKMSDRNDNPELTEKGREQAKNAGQKLREQGLYFDIILHTSLIRAHDTAHIIGEELGFFGEYIVDDGLIEQDMGEYSGKTLGEVAEMVKVDVNDHSALRRFYKENSVENMVQFEERIFRGYDAILEKYRGKKILIVAHAGSPRPLLRKYFGMNREDAHYDTRIHNADPFKLLTVPLVNPLDRWILSRLQVLIGQVHDAMDDYDVSRACRAIVDYMDHLTNWYVRLSRRRFWESGMTPDKESAYETLYTVLTEVSKLLAPFMPFLSESIYKGLTDKPLSFSEGESVPKRSSQSEDDKNGNNSVHLQYVTLPSRHLIANDLNRDMEICEHIVSLGLALRSQKNIRVRQPLQSVTITASLDEYYQAIIRDELNVKKIKFENPEKLAKKIAKPDAKKIGPKYGKEVQSIIVAAKNGEFEEIEGGKLKVGNFILEVGEFILEYLPLEGVGDVVGGYGMVLAMDTTITEELRLEGYARDIIRLIQDMRKEANYNVTDRIEVSIIGEKSDDVLAGFGSLIEGETLSRIVLQINLPDAMREEEIDQDNVIQIAIKR